MPGLPSPGSGAIAIADGSELKFQGEVRFVCGGMDRLKNPRVSVEAHDGEGVLIYAEAGRVFDTFTLGGGSSQWVERGGGPADCIATLFYFKVEGTDREWNGHGQQQYVPLAHVSFQAAG